MKKLTKTELDNILELHKKWLLGEGEWVKANLSNTDLFGADLCYANLSNANLSDANLRYANLRYASLNNADLRYANLRDANLSGASLNNADLHYANLRGADLSGADLSNTNLHYANLRYADLNNDDLNLVNWHEVKGIKVYVAGLQSSRNNAQLTYIPSLDIATTGCWQDTWENTIEQIHNVYNEDSRERKAYDLAIEYINKQVELDSYEK